MYTYIFLKIQKKNMKVTVTWKVFSLRGEES